MVGVLALDAVHNMNASDDGPILSIPQIYDAFAQILEYRCRQPEVTDWEIHSMKTVLDLVKAEIDGFTISSPWHRSLGENYQR